MSADLAAAKRFYGAVVSPPADTPYGRIAVVSDDHGAVFSLIEDTSG